ncbi:MAG: S9 family peptidase [Propioniciclava sp.]|uniref:S9 family peptidase n=1 Tax=Propioniciclava sp. TaxID=2038686 RepID=UPI0039E45D6D
MPDAPLTPPDAPTRPFTREVHGDRVEDPYHWMADKSDPELLAYLEAENAWTDARTAHLAPLTEALFEDLKARTQQTDLSVPTHVSHTDGSHYWYYGRTTEGHEYGRSCRLPATSRDEIPDVTQPPADEQIVLDVNALAEGHDYFSLGWAQVSPGGGRLAYSADTSGDERYDLFVVDLASGAVIDGPIEGVGAGGAWAGDDWIVYVRVDAAWRPHQAWRHHIGGPETDALLYEEADDRFWLSVDTSRDHAWVLLDLGSKKTTETHLLRADNPTGPLRCVQPRRQGLEYAVEVAPDALWILHNDGAPQFALSRAPLEASGIDEWQLVIPERPETRLTGVSVYASAVVVEHRTNALSGIAILPRTPSGELGERVELTFDEALYDVGAEESPDFDTDRIRFGYESLVSPPSVWEYRLDTGERRLLKRTPVLDHPVRGAYDPSAYVSERRWATSEDGTRIPVSVVRGRDVPTDGTAPGLLYGYGSYEIPIMPYFAMSRLSLLDRGFVFAIAHVRGGGELGRPWYEAGKELSKPNTFSDFIACARLLVEEGYVARDRLGAEGGSAGGLLMGAAMNLAPEVFRAVHAAVPFVDPVTTILNPDLPLTVSEWEEWGNPVTDPDVYACMTSYSPYENVAAVEYPAILVTTGLNDTRVEVTEPAKWVARLRDRATNDERRPILLKTEMVAGHGGVSGRYKAWKERAFELAWLIDQLG